MINNIAMHIIKKHEGLRLKAYRCPSNVLTIGYGHTGKDVVKGMLIDEKQAEILLVKDLEKFEKGVRDLLTVETSEREFSAMVSLAFNIGLKAFSRSEVLRKHNNKQKFEACKAFHNWRKSGSKVLRGLVIRRLEEAKLYIGG